MLLFFRIIADMLWEYKIVAILLNVLLFFGIFATVAKIKIPFNKPAKSLVLSLLILAFLFSLSFLQDTNAYIIFFKIFGSLAMCFYGFIYTGNINRVIRYIEIFGIFFIAFFFLFSFLPYGYVYWGSIKTYRGVYFFKTDMALATIISLIFILSSSSLKPAMKIILSAMASYIIIITNARIHLLSVFMVIVLFIFWKSLFKNSGKKMLPFFMALLLCFFAVISFFSDILASYGFLSIKINEDFFSGENMQGRNVIWLALLDGYLASGTFQKILGAGLEADHAYTAMFSEQFQGGSSHSGYFFTIISIGALGFVFFAWFIKIVFRKFLSLIKQIRYSSVLYIFFANMALFLVSSFSCSTIIFQQQTWFFMFFAGYLFNKIYNSQIRTQQ